MNIVRCIRHAQSLANAGSITSAPDSIALSPLGESQARTVADTLLTPPDVFVCSPMLRVRQTARPSQERYPTVRSLIWPIEEFTYLSPARCANTDVSQRRAWVAEFWLRADPDFTDGPGAESFRGFIERVRSALDRLTLLSGSAAVLFGHGQFMQAIRWQLARAAAGVNPQAMHDFRAFDLANPIGNVEGFTLVGKGDVWAVRT